MKLAEEARLQTFSLADVPLQAQAVRRRAQGPFLASLLKSCRKQERRTRAHVGKQGEARKKARDVLQVIRPRSFQEAFDIERLIRRVRRLHEKQQLAAEAAASCQRLCTSDEMRLFLQSFEQNYDVVLLSPHIFFQLRQRRRHADMLIKQRRVIDLGSCSKKRLLQDADQRRSEARESDEEDILVAHFIRRQKLFRPQRLHHLRIILQAHARLSLLLQPCPPCCFVKSLDLVRIARAVHQGRRLHASA